MPLQRWSPVAVVPAYASASGPAGKLRSLTPNADGGYTVFLDQGSSFGNSMVAVPISSFGNFSAAPTIGRILTGFVEWGSALDEVVLSGSNLFYTYDSFRVEGLAPGGAILRSMAGDVQGSPLSSTIAPVGDFIIRKNVTLGDFSIDTAAMPGGAAVSVMTAEQNASAGFIPVAAIPAAVFAAIRAGGGSTTTITVAAPGGPDVRDATVTGFADSSFLVFWTQDGSDGSVSGLRAQRVSPVGALLGGAFNVNQNVAGAQSKSHAATMADGNAFVAWADASGTLGDASGSSIKGRIVRPDGTFATSEFRINQSVSGDQTLPHVVALGAAQDQALVLWRDVPTSSIRGIVIDATGNVQSSEIEISAAGLPVITDSITGTLLADGRVAIGWTQTGTNNAFMTIVDPRPQLIVTSDGSELILGRESGTPLANDAIAALDGNDTILALGGDDTVSGGGGDDLIFGGEGNDLLVGDDGNDLIFGDSGSSTMQGGNGNDTIYGSFGNDVISGDAGDDVLVGIGGADTFYGGTGFNYIVAGDGPGSVIYGGPGGTASMWGGNGADTIIGDTGADILVGGAGNDSLFAGGGDDAIYGGAGTDYITGSSGNDFIYTDDIGVTETDYLYIGFGTGIDIVADFKATGPGADVIVFTNSVFTNLAQVQAATTQVGIYTAISMPRPFDLPGVPADIIYLYNVDSTTLSGSNFIFL